MTFTLPDELATQFVRQVPTRQRSRYLAQALSDKLAGQDKQLVRACEIANRNLEVQAIEKEFDSLSAEIAEPWSSPTARRRVVGGSRSRPRIGN